LDKKLFYVNNILMSLEFALNLLFQSLTSFSRSTFVYWYFAIVHSIQKIYMQAVRSFNITFGAFIIRWISIFLVFVGSIKPWNLVHKQSHIMKTEFKC